MKDESEWIKIPNHHPAIVSRELFEQVNSQRLHFKSVKKLAREYPLRGKVFCGCYRHAMPRTPAKNHQFICRYTKVDENAPCHGMKIVVIDKELERLKQIHAALAAQTTQMQMDEKLKSARMTLAQEISKASGLTAGLADTLIERVNIYPGNQMEIVWKMKDFYMEEM